MVEVIKGALSLGLLWAIMTIGVYITYRILSIADLTVEGSITLGAAIAAHAITSGMNPYLGTLIALLGGMAAGLCTGLLHTKLKIPALLSGILTMIGLYSINLRVMGKANISLLRMENVYTVFENMGLEPTWATITLGAISVAAIVCLLYWFFGTELGCAIRATGNNPYMVRAQGINTNTMIIRFGNQQWPGLPGWGLNCPNQKFFRYWDKDRLHCHRPGIGYRGEVLFGKGIFHETYIPCLRTITYRIIIAFVQAGYAQQRSEALYCNNGSHCPVPAYDQGFCKPAQNSYRGG